MEFKKILQVIEKTEKNLEGVSDDLKKLDQTIILVQNFQAKTYADLQAKQKELANRSLGLSFVLGGLFVFLLLFLLSYLV